MNQKIRHAGRYEESYFLTVDIFNSLAPHQYSTVSNYALRAWLIAVIEPGHQDFAIAKEIAVRIFALLFQIF